MGYRFEDVLEYSLIRSGAPQPIIRSRVGGFICARVAGGRFFERWRRNCWHS